MRMTARPATRDDAAAITRIFNEGIEDANATFETRYRTAKDVEAWLSTRFPVAVVEEGGEVVGFAAAFAYSDRECYSHVADASVYIGRMARGRGAGRLVLEELVRMAEEAGLAKLIGKIHTDNAASRALVLKNGFREVGVHEKHGKLNGVWKDILVVERIIPANL
jgi:L-amino acid N-acyltransferase YncA